MKLMNKNAIFKIVLLAKKESVSLNEEETVILGGDSTVLSLPKIESALVGAAVLLLIREKGSDVMPLYVMLCVALVSFFFLHSSFLSFTFQSLTRHTHTPLSL
jgi:hypothetical protein